MNAALGSTEPVLLVGDGDFSFTLALTKYLPPSCIIGTNLETKESIQKHRNAQNNMSELLEIGVHLILGVDARQLHTHPEVGHQHFQRIIFNFPHIGGKSNNKKNRALLNDFFRSAASVLTPEGEVMVTLCQGQGGTEADQPQRSWADSWQIVSMAANSGFTLTQVIPFKTEIYPGYSCTGFRSQDKGFHTKGSLTHTFQRQDAVPVPQDVKPLPVILDKKEFLCPRYLHSKISSYRKILENALHPIKQTQDLLIYGMEMCKIVKYLSEDQLPCVMLRSDLAVTSPEFSACQLKLCKSLAEKGRLFTPDCQKATNVNSDGFPSSAGVLESPENQTVSKDGMESYFRTSLIENIPLLLDCEDFEKSQLLLTSGLTYKQGVISPGFLPVSIELLGLTKCNVEENKLEEINETLSCSLKTCSLSTNFTTSVHKTWIQIIIKTIAVEFVAKIMCKNIAEEMCIGHIFKISNQSKENEIQFWGFLINVDIVTQVRFSVQHKSILWHENLGKFLKPYPQHPSATTAKYKPICIFPLKFVHDMSFWENAALAFDENQLSSIVRDVAGDCVSSVTLIDTYHEPETKRTGRCYRLTFQSWDLCLSYETSWKLQSLIRLVTAEKMGITLR